MVVRSLDKRRAQLNTLRWGSASLALLAGVVLVSWSSVGITSAQAQSRRVSRELVEVCGDYRCEDYHFAVRVPIQPDDTIMEVQERLDEAMFREVDRIFRARPDVLRVILEGRIYDGTDRFVSREVLVRTLFVPRHRWVVGRYNVEDDSVYFEELLPQIQALLEPVTIELTPPDAEAPTAPGAAPALPPLPPLPSEAPGADPDAPPPPEGTVQRGTIEAQ